MKKTFTLLPLLFLLMFLIVDVASAHVTVEPTTVQKGAYQKFTVNVPNEMDKPVTSVKLVIPNNVEASSVEPVPGWSFKLVTDKTDKITAITWKATDKGLRPNEFIEFNLMARVSDTAKRLTWKAYQTYSGGTLVKWIGPESSEHPASVTKVTSDAFTESAPTSIQDKASTSATSSRAFNSWPLYLSIFSLILSGIALIISFLKKQ